MNTKTWNALDRLFAEDIDTAGRRITTAHEVPSESEIKASAIAIGCTFHTDYVEFLGRYGGAMVGGRPIFGLRSAEVMGSRWSVVDMTQLFRSQGWPGVCDWYVLSEDGAGNPIGVSKDGKIWLSDHDTGEVVQIADNFEKFLFEHCIRSS